MMEGQVTLASGLCLPSFADASTMKRLKGHGLEDEEGARNDFYMAQALIEDLVHGDLTDMRQAAQLMGDVHDRLLTASRTPAVRPRR